MREVPSGEFDYCIIGESLFNHYVSAVIASQGKNVLILDSKNIRKTPFATFHLIDLLKFINSENDEHYFFNFHCSDNVISYIDNSSESMLKAASTLLCDPKSATFKDLLSCSNKFSIDLFPFVIGTNGSTVNSVLKFDVSYHISVFSPSCTRIYVDKLGKFCTIPLNKNQVFVSECLSFDEKYFFTKFIQNCFSLLENIDEVQDMDLEIFLHQNHIHDHLATFLQFSILFDWNSITSRNQRKLKFLHKLQESFEAIKKFNTNSKYLMSVNGCQDLNHCYLRKASVMGATTCYGVPIKAVNQVEDKCEIVFLNNSSVKAKRVIMDHAYANFMIPEGVLARNKMMHDYIFFNHCILITTSSHSHLDRDENNVGYDFMVIPNENEKMSHVWIIKFGSGNLCPRGCDLVHFTCVGINNHAESMRLAVKKYLECYPVKVLWKCQYLSKHSNPENCYLRLLVDETDIYITNSLICTALSDDVIDKANRFIAEELKLEGIDNLD